MSCIWFVMARVAVAALVLLASVVHAAPHDVPSTCRARLENAYTTGKMPANLAVLCAPADASAERIEPSWLTATELGAEVDIVRYWDLLRLADDIDSAARQAPLSHALLPDILAQTTVDVSQPPSWWQRFQAWLKARLKDDEDLDLSWLDDWLRMLDRHSGLLEVVMRITVVLTLVAALYLVLREIELLGGFAWRWRHKPHRPALASRATTSVPAPLSWAEVQASPAATRPAALLRWLLFELHAHGLLPRDESLTNREQLSLLAARMASLHGPFARVLDDVEPCIYGGHAPVAVEELATRVSALREAAIKS